MLTHKLQPPEAEPGIRANVHSHGVCAMHKCLHVVLKHRRHLPFTLQ